MKKIILPFSDFLKKNHCTFEVKTKKQVFKGFAFKKGNQYFAYQNLCQHLPVALNFNSDKLLTKDEKLIQCQMHGALYEIETGKCVDGPCVGEKLTSLTYEETENGIVISIPDELLTK